MSQRRRTAFHVLPALALSLGFLATSAERSSAQDSLEVRIINQYVAHFQLEIGSATRIGVDTLKGTLGLQPDGTWQGFVETTRIV
jgi:hypothetical protein